MLRATPYTPVFPPSVRAHDSPASASTSCGSNSTVDGDSQISSKKAYIDRLKERYILLASMPQDELCPPSREASPGSEGRITALRLRMRKARELQFPHDPGLTLACVGVKGGDWVGESESDYEDGGREYVLPDTEEEWFQWKRKTKAAREQRVAERKAAERKQKIAKWSEDIEDVTSGRLYDGSPQARRQREDGSGVLDLSVVKNSTTTRTKGKVTTSRYFKHRSPPPRNSRRDDSEPVERMSSPMPPAPALDPLPDFSDSFSIPNSPPSLPQLPPDIPLPNDVPRSPSFALKDFQISTPHKQNSPSNTVFQLSSPISPPRSIRPLTASRTLSSLPRKRPREGADPASEALRDIMENPSTPHPIKKARTAVEPITPASVPRLNCSQENIPSPNLKRLPTLTALLASSRKTPRSPSRLTQTPCRDPGFSPSQPTYSMFRPQFQSTQPRTKSLPPSPSQPMTSTPPISPQKSLAGLRSFSGMGLYQSQFNVEGKIGEVAAFLNADVWDVET